MPTQNVDRKLMGEHVFSRDSRPMHRSKRCAAVLRRRGSVRASESESYRGIGERERKNRLYSRGESAARQSKARPPTKPPLLSTATEPVRTNKGTSRLSTYFCRPKSSRPCIAEPCGRWSLSYTQSNTDDIEHGIESRSKNNLL